MDNELKSSHQFETPPFSENESTGGLYEEFSKEIKEKQNEITGELKEGTHYEIKNGKFKWKKGVKDCIKNGKIDLNGKNDLTNINALKNVKGITSLKLGRTKIDSNAIKVISTLTDLQHLSLTGTGLFENWNTLENLSNLEELDLSGVKINNTEDLLFLKNLKKLKKLNLGLIKKINTSLAIDYITGLEKLTHLSLSGCRKIEGEDLSGKFKQLTNLVLLNLEGVGIEPKDLEGIKDLNKLEYLNLHLNSINYDKIKDSIKSVKKRVCLPLGMNIGVNVPKDMIIKLDNTSNGFYGYDEPIDVPIKK